MSCACDVSSVPLNVSHCVNCVYSNGVLTGSKKEEPETMQKKLQKTIRLSQSEYLMNRSALTVFKSARSMPALLNWNQSSDNPQASVVVRNVPRNGSSTRSSITRHRPGSTSASGTGVDVKHGSYARYLARKKGRSALRRVGEKRSVINGCKCPP
jgi:hypothetical protein